MFSMPLVIKYEIRDCAMLDKSLVIIDNMDWGLNECI